MTKHWEFGVMPPDQWLMDEGAMRVLWVFEHLWCQPTLQHVASQLADQPDIQLEILTPWDDKPPVEDSRIQLTNLRCRHKIDFAARRVIRDKLNSGNFDIAHAYSSRDLANLLAARPRGKRRTQLVGYRGTVNRLQRFDPGHWMTFWHPALDHIICVCEATRDTMLASNIPAKKLTTVWEGCQRDVLATPARSELTERFSIPHDAFVVGTVANMRPVKGVDLLLEAAAQLKDLPIYWLLIGDDRDPRIAPLAKNQHIAERVRLPGAIPDGGRYSGVMDVYIAPSRMEGLSMGIMEAMTQKVCPVVTRVGGSPELVRDGQDGLVVPPESPEALATAIRRLFQDPKLRSEMAASANRRIEAVFSIDHWSKRLTEFYRRRLDAQSPKRHAA